MKCTLCKRMRKRYHYLATRTLEPEITRTVTPNTSSNMKREGCYDDRDIERGWRERERSVIRRKYFRARASEQVITITKGRMSGKTHTKTKTKKKKKKKWRAERQPQQ
jgi:hypothetical protein